MATKNTYTTKEDDVLDAICYSHYGKTSGVVEQVLDANPGLCEYDVFLPAGVVIILPEEKSQGVTSVNSSLAYTA